MNERISSKAEVALRPSSRREAVDGAQHARKNADPSENGRRTASIARDAALAIAAPERGRPGLAVLALHHAKRRRRIGRRTIAGLAVAPGDHRGRRRKQALVAIVEGRAAAAAGLTALAVASPVAGTAAGRRFGLGPLVAHGRRGRRYRQLRRGFGRRGDGLKRRARQGVELG